MTGIDQIERPIGRRLIDAAGRVDKICADDTPKHLYFNLFSHYASLKCFTAAVLISSPSYRANAMNPI